MWKTWQWPQDWKRSVFIPIPKRVNAKKCSNYHTVALISHASKIIPKIPRARLQQYVNWKLPDVQGGFRKGRGTRYQVANIHWIIEKAREFQKNIYFCFIDYAKTFDCVVPTNWKFLQEMGIPDHLTGLLRVCQGCILSPCLFNLHAEYIVRNAGLDEAQAGIKIGGRKINNLRYADDITFMAKSEKLNSFLLKMKEESEKVGLKLNI